jgi:ADP-ribose pyrophosphatase YjhB (NUDIX family)
VIADKPERPAIGVGGVVWKGDEVLLIQRGKDPGKGRWSLPGGHQEWGETVADAVIREIREETGVEVMVGALIDVVDALISGDAGTLAYHFTLLNYRCDWVSGDVVAGDDAADAKWFNPKDLTRLGLWEETIRVIEKSAQI